MSGPKQPDADGGNPHEKDGLRVSAEEARRTAQEIEQAQQVLRRATARLSRQNADFEAFRRQRMADGGAAQSEAEDFEAFRRKRLQEEKGSEDELEALDAMLQKRKQTLRQQSRRATPAGPAGDVESIIERRKLEEQRRRREQEKKNKGTDELKALESILEKRKEATRKGRRVSGPSSRPPEPSRPGRGGGGTEDDDFARFRERRLSGAQPRPSGKSARPVGKIERGVPIPGSEERPALRKKELGHESDEEFAKFREQQAGQTRQKVSERIRANRERTRATNVPARGRSKPVDESTEDEEFAKFREQQLKQPRKKKKKDEPFFGA